MRKIRIAIVGVGNCASSLVQGLNFYDGSSSANGTSVGLMHRQIGGYRPSDIEVVAAFDIDRRKVGLDVSKAIFSPPNCTKAFCEKIKLTGAIVKMGCVLDGYPPHMQDQDPLRTFLPLEKETTREEIIDELKNSSAELMVNYLPVGSEQATRFYAGCALEADSALSITSQSLSRAIRLGRNDSPIKICRLLGTILRRRWAPPSCIGHWSISFASAA
jgi:Myo-inositol-1-phosphate synthase